MDARTKEIVTTFGHDVYLNELTDGFRCDHPRCSDDFVTEEGAWRHCCDVAQDQYETDMLRDGTHPALGDYDGSGR